MIKLHFLNTRINSVATLLRIVNAHYVSFDAVWLQDDRLSAHMNFGLICFQTDDYWIKPYAILLKCRKGIKTDVVIIEGSTTYLVQNDWSAKEKSIFYEWIIREHRLFAMHVPDVPMCALRPALQIGFHAAKCKMLSERWEKKPAFLNNEPTFWWLFGHHMTRSFYQPSRSQNFIFYPSLFLK